MISGGGGLALMRAMTCGQPWRRRSRSSAGAPRGRHQGRGRRRRGDRGDGPSGGWRRGPTGRRAPARDGLALTLGDGRAHARPGRVPGPGSDAAGAARPALGRGRAGSGAGRRRGHRGRAAAGGRATAMGRGRRLEQRELQLEPQATRPEARRVDRGEPSRRRGQRLDRPPGREVDEHPVAQRVDGLVEEDPQVTPLVPRAGRAARSRPRRRRSTSADVEAVDELPSARPRRSRTASASIGPLVEDSSWSRIDSASRMPPAARRAISSTASGSASRPSDGEDPLELAGDLRHGQRRTSNRWRRDRIAGGKSCGCVDANMKTTKSGGSSSDLRSAFQASFVIWWASSRM